MPQAKLFGLNLLAVFLSSGMVVAMLHAEVRAASKCVCYLSTPARSDLSGYFTQEGTLILNPKYPEAGDFLEAELGCRSPRHAASQLQALGCRRERQGSGCSAEITCQ